MQWQNIYDHKVHTYTEYNSTRVPSSELGSPSPLSRQRVSPYPRNQREGAHSPAGEGLGESQFRRLEKKLSTLPTRCTVYDKPVFLGKVIIMWNHSCNLYRPSGTIRSSISGSCQGDSISTERYVRICKYRIIDYLAADT
jgi:hypothetical protein